MISDKIKEVDGGGKLTLTDIPNSGVKFHLGSYKVKLIIHTGYGRTRSLAMESEDTTGLYSDELIDQLQIDVENLRKSAKQCVVDAKKEREKE